MGKDWEAKNKKKEKTSKKKQKTDTGGGMKRTEGHENFVARKLASAQTWRFNVYILDYGKQFPGKMIL